ncbi:hypothetical protein MKW92_038810 [Papaver armeniacum]|nr:hypothetical protein MKW92_038810 [Papaver armeniacum]
MASTSHREVVLAELNASHVSIMISPEELAATVAQVIRPNLLTFSDEDFPPEGKIITERSKSQSWLHANLAVSSTLHQKLRFIYGDKLITIQGDLEEEEGKGKNNHITIPAVETNMEDNNYTEESVNQVFYKALSREKLPSWFEHGNTKVAHYLRKYRFFHGMGLCVRGNGLTEPLDGQQASHEDPYGLGYHPTEEDRLKRELEKSPWNRQARKAAGIYWSTQPSLNGHFIRKGDSSPYMGFKEPSFMKRMTIDGGIGEII